MADKLTYGLTRRTRAADPVSLPESYNYIGVFLTFRCPYRCSYCINRFHGNDALAAGETSGKDWIAFFDRLETNDVPITLQGGEPGLHPDFAQIVARASERHFVDILTNLAFDLDEFARAVDPERLNREAPYAPIRVSYHPEQFSLEEIIERTLFLRDAGFRIGLYGVTHPSQLSAIALAQAVCADLGIDFRTKPFLGRHDGVLHGEYAYPDAVAAGKREWRECAPSELLIAPDGGIHRCHSFLYTGARPLGRIGDKALKLTDDYLACNRYGECSPCDVKVKNNRFQQFGHVSARIRHAQ